MLPPVESVLAAKDGITKTSNIVTQLERNADKPTVYAKELIDFLRNNAATKRLQNAQGLHDRSTFSRKIFEAIRPGPGRQNTVNNMAKSKEITAAGNFVGEISNRRADLRIAGKAAPASRFASSLLGSRASGETLTEITSETLPGQVVSDDNDALLNAPRGRDLQPENSIMSRSLMLLPLDGHQDDGTLVVSRYSSF